jgi:condensation domain-containing protein
MQLENTEDFYPLSPLQEGLLFHALYSPEGGEYISQISCVMRGDLNVTALKEAWQRVVQRHAALRTFFLWEGLKKPVQVVQKHLALTWEELDWRGLTNEVQREQLAAYLAQEQTRSFQLSRAPLMRLALIRLNDDEFEFVWSHHHLLLDGWSTSRVTNEVILIYRALSQGEHLLLSNPRPYRDYIAWLQQQDLGEAESYWRKTLKGFTTPTPLVPDDVPESARKGDYIVRQLKLTTSATALLQDEASRQGLTLNTLVQGAWALLLSHYTGQHDVVFGATVSGRPPELRGIEEMVGIFINTLPVRVKIAPEMRVVDWLRRLQDEQLETRRYEYSPLSRIQGWSEVQRGSLLFQSIVVFENYPEQSSPSATVGKAQVGAWDIRHFIKESYPMTLMAAPGTQLRMEIKYDNSLFDAATIGQMSEHLETLLHNVLSRHNVWQQTLGEVLERARAEREGNEERKVKQVRVQMLKQVKRKLVTTC